MICKTAFGIASGVVFGHMESPVAALSQQEFSGRLVQPTLSDPFRLSELSASSTMGSLPNAGAYRATCYPH